MLLSIVQALYAKRTEFCSQFKDPACSNKKLLPISDLAVRKVTGVKQLSSSTANSDGDDENDGLSWTLIQPLTSVIIETSLSRIIVVSTKSCKLTDYNNDNLPDATAAQELQ